VYEVSGDTASAVVLCDHPSGITIGREGSREHVRLTGDQLEARQWPVRWIARGGGVALHVPGQVACYPVLPLDRLGLTPTQYLATLCDIVATLAGGFGIEAEVDAAAPAVRVRGRRVATFGVAIRNGVTSFGFVLNVAPDLDLFRAVECDGDATPMTSLQRECPTRVRPTAVRQRLLDLLTDRFGFGRLSVFHTHPTFLPRVPRHASAARPR
jgi:lipoyl(octanoyl) transferase